jgi:hypothetical protein
MATTGQERGQQQNRQGQGSDAEQRIQHYMLENEEISYVLRFRETGLVAWLKSLLGYGVTHWFVTNQRLIQETRIGGGFVFEDIPHGKMSSIGYGTRLPLGALAAGILLSISGFLAAAFLDTGGSISALALVAGLGLVAYAYLRRRQVLEVHASGGVSFALNIKKGQQVDELLWYLHAERNKHT